MTAHRTMDRRVAAGPASLRSYVACWALAGAVGMAIVLVVVDPAGRTITPALLVLLGLTAVAEAVSVNMRSGDSGVTLSLLEAAVVVDMLLLGPSGGVMAVVGAIVLQHVIRGLAPLKIIFNAGQHAVGASVAALLLAAAPGPSPVGMGRAVAMLLAVTLYRVISTRALVGIFARLDADTLRDKVDHRWLELAATALGNASLGVIAASLWSSHPTVVWIVAAPAPVHVLRRELPDRGPVRAGPRRTRPSRPHRGRGERRDRAARSRWPGARVERVDDAHARPVRGRGRRGVRSSCETRATKSSFSAAASRSRARSCTTMTSPVHRPVSSRSSVCCNRRGTSWPCTSSTRASTSSSPVWPRTSRAGR